MADVLKGNFSPSKRVEVDEAGEALEDRFEKAALKRLGGSICFVSKKKVLWNMEPEDSA